MEKHKCSKREISEGVPWHDQGSVLRIYRDFLFGTIVVYHIRDCPRIIDAKSPNSVSQSDWGHLYQSDIDIDHNDFFREEIK